MSPDDSSSPSSEVRPLFSVIIPTHARPERLRACLEGMATLDFPRDQFEVIVSDDGSPTPVEPVVAAFRDRLRITLVTHPRTGPAAARNRGAARAEGTHLAFIDDDCAPAADWLTALAGRFARTPDHLVGGMIVNALPKNPFSTATQLIVTYVYDYYDRGAKGAHLFNTGNLAVPAERFNELGGFSESFPLAAGEDYDFCHRWRHAGYRTTYAPEAVVRHSHILTFAGFCRQHFNYGRGLFAHRLRVARRTHKPLRGESPRFYWHLLRFPLTRGQGGRGWVYALLVALSQAATAAGVLREALMKGWQIVSSHGPAGNQGPRKVVG